MIVMWIIIAYILFSIVMAPNQYRYICHLKEIRKKAEENNSSQGKMYDKMSYQEQQLNYSVQSNFLLVGSNIIATIYYKLKNKK